MGATVTILDSFTLPPPFIYEAKGRDETETIERERRQREDGETNLGEP
jgi:hypothetical protein